MSSLTGPDNQASIRREFEIDLLNLRRKTDRAFLKLMGIQWIFGIVCALLISPRTWSGTESSVHIHLWMAVFLGGLIVGFPCYLIMRKPHMALTRWSVAASQAAMSALLIHLMSGRIEAHFHIFGILAFLAFYLDRGIYLPVVSLLVLDHLLRGLLYPESVFGVSTPTVLRALEHAGWVLFETSFLLWGIREYRKQIYGNCRLRVSLDAKGDTLEEQVRLRTMELDEAKQFSDSIIDSVSNEICILDGDGVIIKTNEVWDAFAMANNGSPCVQSNYIHVCRQATGKCSRSARLLADGIEDVISGKLPHFTAEYECHSDREERWFQVTVNPIELKNRKGAVVCHTNISERVLSEQERIKQKEYAEQLALVAKYTDNAVVITDECGRIEWTNEGFTRITGYSSEEVLGRVPGHFLQGEATDPATVAYMRECIAGKQGFNVEIVNYDKQGRNYWLEVEVRPIEDANGDVRRFIAIETDITKRKEAEAVLENLNRELHDHNLVITGERRLLNTIVEAIPYGIYWKSLDLDFVGCNASFARFSNLKHADDCIGRTEADLGIDATITRARRKAETQVINQKHEIRNREERHHDANGTETILWWSSFPLLDETESVIGLVGVVMDVTENQKVQMEREELLKEAAELASIIRSSPSEIYIFRRDDFQFVEVNQGACLSTGYSANDLRGMTALDLVDKITPQEYEKLLSPLSREDQSEVEFHCVHVRSDGSQYPVQARLHAAEYRGTPVYVAFVSDLTTVCSLEQQLSQAQKLESLGQLSAGIAHEINTPIQFVGDNLEFLSDAYHRVFKVLEYCDDLFETESAKTVESLHVEYDRLKEKSRFDYIRQQLPLAIEESREGIQRTVGILQAMKDFSHLGNRERSEIDLNHCLESTVTITRNRWKYAASLTTDFAENLPTVSGYNVELNQVFLNLIVNAADAVSERFDEGKLGEILIRTFEDSGWVVVEVADNGCGIPEKLTQKIFDPFFTTKEVGKGTGQGLAITHSVVTQMHDGRLNVESTEGKGTTFQVCFPAKSRRETNEFPKTDDTALLVN